MSSDITEVESPAATSQDRPISPRVSLRGVGKVFKQHKSPVRVLDDINLDIHEGELLVLLGPSGCGKTTLLRCLTGLERPSEGFIELGGTTVVDAESGFFVNPERRDVGMVFQNYALWPHMRVAQNVGYPLKARKMREELRGGRVEEVLRLVQCDHLADRYPSELSGGQQQRVSLARAIAPRPALLLLDEPLSNLDALLRIELRTQLRNLHRTLGFTGVYVTHDQEEALALGTRVAVMKAGRFEQVGTPEEVHRWPATDYVAEFLGGRNRLDASVDAHGQVSILGIPVPLLSTPDRAGSYSVRLRPSQLALVAPSTPPSADRVALPGAVVVESFPTIEYTDYVVEVGECQLQIRDTSGAAAFDAGRQVTVSLARGALLFYDLSGALVRDVVSAS